MFEIFECVAVVFETFIVYYYISGLFVSKAPAKSILIGYSAFCIGLMVLTLFLQTSILLSVYTLAGMFCMLHFLYEARLESRIFSLLYFSVIIISSEIFCSFLFSRLWMSNLPDVLSYGLPRAVIIIISKLFQIMAVKITVYISKWKNKRLVKIEITMVLPLLLCQIISILLAHYIFLICLDTNQKFDSAALLSMLGIIYINIIIFWYFDRLKIFFEYKSRNEVAEYKLEMQKKYLDMQTLHQKETDALWHDMKKHINLMKSLIDDDQQAITSKYIHELEAQMGETCKIVRTNYPVLSALLTEQVQKAQKAKISLDIDVKLESELKISPVELCIILGNLFDNAFEAIAHLSPDMEKSIKISILQRNGAVLIHIENPFMSKSKAKPRTRKHGYGIKNIRHVVEKNRGNLEIKNDGGLYQVSIIIP